MWWGKFVQIRIIRSGGEYGAMATVLVLQLLIIPHKFLFFFFSVVLPGPGCLAVCRN